MNLAVEFNNVEMIEMAINNYSNQDLLRQSFSLMVKQKEIISSLQNQLVKKLQSKKVEKRRRSTLETQGSLKKKRKLL